MSVQQTMINDGGEKWSISCGAFLQDDGSDFIKPGRLFDFVLLNEICDLFDFDELNSTSEFWNNPD